MKNFRWNLPNILTLYRLVTAPVLLLCVYLGWSAVFAILFAINLLTDFLDGLLARKMGLASEAGALLDSYADFGSYIAATYAIVTFHFYLFTDFGAWLITFLALYAAKMVIIKLRYGKWVSGVHLYSSKATGYIQGSFLLVLFAWKFIPLYFFIAIAVGCLAELEVISITLASPKPIINAKGWYWIIKEKRLKN